MFERFVIMGMIGLIVGGCGAPQKGADEGAGALEGKEVGPRWVAATLSGGGDCGVPLLTLHEAVPGVFNRGFQLNALGFSPGVEAGPIEVVLKTIEPGDTRTQVVCHTLGPGRSWVEVVQWRRRAE